MPRPTLPNPSENRLGARLALMVLAVSVAVTLAVTLAQLAYNLGTDRARLDARLDAIKDSHLPSLTFSLWNLDDHHLRVQLEGILKARDIKYVEVNSIEGSVYRAGEPPPPRLAVSRTLEMKHRNNQREVVIGTTLLVASEAGIWERLKAQALFILATQGVQVSLVSASLLILFELMVTRRLRALALFAKGVGADPARAAPAPGLAGRADELGALAAAVDQARVALIREGDERLALTQALRHRHEALRVALDSSHMGIWSWLDGAFQWDKRCRAIFGVDHDPETLQEFQALLEESSRTHLAAVTERALKTGAFDPCEFQTARADGERIWVHYSAKVLTGGEAGQAGLIGGVRDTTDQQRTEELLRDYNRNLESQVEERTRRLTEKNEELEAALKRLRVMQDQLVVQEKLASLGTVTAGIAHEIKNPLNLIGNYSELATEMVAELRAQLVEADRLPPELLKGVENSIQDLERACKTIHVHGKRADNIVKSMLQHSRAQAGNREWSDLNELIDEYLNLSVAAARNNHKDFNLQVRKNYDPETGVADVVPQDLGRVFLNLFNNAIYAMREKAADNRDYVPTLEVATRSKVSRIEIRVRDNGPGIPNFLTDKIFTPFFTTKPAGSGTGLGLSISHDIIVREHHGTMDVESKVGQFTEFIMVLPRAL